MKRILVSPLSWGLGHATRDLPIIRYFLERGHEVTIAASDRALALLRHEAPGCEFLELADYPTPYSATRFFVPKFLAMAPVMIRAMHREARNVRRLLAERDFDLILSDNRFNVCSREIPSFLISHQLRFHAPSALRPFRFVTELFNYFYHRHFRAVIVPDYADPVENLSGQLAHGLWLARRRKIYYAGILSSVRRMDVAEDVDVFISVSGPEPQRTELERIVLARIQECPGERIVVTLGKPEVKETRAIGERITVHGFLDRAGQEEMMNRAKLTVCRSGYTTVMELAELGKKALFIPTPGQTEQEYLAWYYARRGWFHAASQYRLDLPRDIARAQGMAGLPFRADTRENVEKLYAEVFAPVLDSNGRV